MKTCPVEKSLELHLVGLDEDEDLLNAVDELSERLYSVAFKAMRDELASTNYSGKTTAADMSNAIDECMFDDIAETLIKKAIKAGI